MEILIRNESEEDTSVVEEVTREAFWNLCFPGCSEHYIVHAWRFQTSPVYECHESDVEDFDKRFPPKEKGYQYSQEIFSIAFRSFLR